MFFLMGVFVSVSNSPLIEKFGIKINQRNSRSIATIQHKVNGIQKFSIQFYRRVSVRLEKKNLSEILTYLQTLQEEENTSTLGLALYKFSHPMPADIPAETYRPQARVAG